MRYINVKYVRPTTHGCVCALAKPDSIPGPLPTVKGGLNLATAIYRVRDVPANVRDEDVVMLFSLTAISTYRRYKLRFEELGEGKIILD